MATIDVHSTRDENAFQKQIWATVKETINPSSIGKEDDVLALQREQLKIAKEQLRLTRALLEMQGWREIPPIYAR